MNIYCLEDKISDHQVKRNATKIQVNIRLYLLLEDGNRLAIDNKVAVIFAHRSLEFTMGAVIFQHVNLKLILVNLKIQIKKKQKKNLVIIITHVIK